jgi:uncharacterized protein (TIGR03382 family)
MKRIFALASLLLVTPAAADSITLTPGQGDSIDEDTAPRVMVERPRTAMVYAPVDPANVLPAVNSHVIFLNRCASGCRINVGNSDSTVDTWPINLANTLTPFGYGDTTWNSVVSCVKTVFAPFNVQITETDPGTAPHFEVMIAGSPGDLGFPNNVGGIAPFDCGASFIPNALVFDFANVWQGNVDEICATAAQEIAHAWTMDHVTEPSDPMTYNPYNGVRYFKDGVQCGSDCVNGKSPFGYTCSGQNHVCSCPQQQGNPTNTQNDIQIITALFGAGSEAPPAVSIDAPKNGAAVEAGFPVMTTITDPVGVTMAELRVDGTLTQTLMSSPYNFNAPTTLHDGAHHVEVTGYGVSGMSTMAAVDVVIGKPCSKPSDCPDATDTCVAGRCVPGPGAPGGLGQPCQTNTDCASDHCASDGTQQVCVELCVPGMGQCPSGFGCATTGANAGVCFPGFDDGSGGALCSTTGGGPISLGLVLAAFVLIQRRRR